MRRHVVTFALILFCAQSAFAAKKLSVAQLEQLLPTLCQHRDDADCANQISDLELTERLESAKLTTLFASLPGDASRKRLLALTDTSAFLPLPAAEISATPAPDVLTQRRILGAVVAYVSKTIPKLPNFYATREVQQFADQPQLQLDQWFIPYEPVHTVASSTGTVLFRNGLEVVDSGKQVEASSSSAHSGLNSWGTFGPVLGIVLVDAARSSLVWSHWETTAQGQIAVFRYAVPQANSHYDVDYCCVADLQNKESNGKPFREFAAYQGEIAVDPATGAILRLTIVAELKPSDPITEARIMVEYGPVDIGGQPYICPIRSISISRAEMPRFDPKYHRPIAFTQAPIQTRLIDLQYGDYHVFRADTRIVVADSKESEGNGSTPTPPTAANPASAAPPADQAATAIAPGTAPAEASAPPAPADANPGQPPVSVAASEPPEFSVAGDAQLPDSTSQPGNGNLTLHAEARSVDINIVVTDKKGQPIRNLQKSDFEIKDDGVAQTIQYFAAPAETAPSQQTAEPTAQPSDDSFVFQNRAQESSSPRRGQPTVILLMDASNLSFADLTNARQQILKFLQSVDHDMPVGLYVLGAQGYRILNEPTADHAAIANRLSRWMPTAQELSQAQQEEELNRQQINEVHKPDDLARVNGNMNLSDPDGGLNSLDPQLRDYGRNPGRDALSFLLPLAKHLSALPGHKSLVWVASDNVLADWAGQSTDVGNNSASLNSAFLRTQEALNDALVSIFPMDVSQLEGGAIDASLQHRNVELNQAAKDMASLAASAGAGAPSASTSQDASSARNMNPGRITAQMQQDLHAIAPQYQQMATATGGRALRRAGDLAHELDGIAADRLASYQLSFSPQGSADDKYHHITISVSQRAARLRYRTGYVFARQPTSLHDRFQKAIWQSGDVNEIGLTATVSGDPDGRKLRLCATAADLGLAQHGDRWSGTIDLFVIAHDGPNQRAQVSGQAIGLNLKPSTYQSAVKDGLPLEVPLPATAKEVDLRILLVDRATQHIGTLTISAAQLSRASHNANTANEPSKQ